MLYVLEFYIVAVHLFVHEFIHCECVCMCVYMYVFLNCMYVCVFDGVYCVPVFHQDHGRMCL